MTSTPAPTRSGLLLGYTFFVTNVHPGAWRKSAKPFDKLTLDYYRDIAQQAEKAGVHFLLFGDGTGDSAGGDPQWLPTLDPFTVASALSTQTSEIGFAISASTIVHDPYTIARSLGSVDHLSGGRVGWNILTSYYPEKLQRFYTVGRQLDYADRYRHSAEFIDVVRGLGAAWAPDAILADADSGAYLRPGSITPLDYEGEFFRVRGALDLARSPQDEIVRFLPVGTERGERFAAKYAEVVFAQAHRLADAHGLRTRIRALAEGEGRDPNSIAIAPGIVVVLGDSRSDALARLDAIGDGILDTDAALAALRALLGWEAGVGSAGAVGLEHPVSEERKRGQAAWAVEQLEAGSATFSDVARRLALINRFPFFYGSVADVADEIEQWYESEAVDGFVLGPVVVPDGFTEIAEQLVPELHRRGITQRNTAGDTTLRRRLGLV